MQFIFRKKPLIFSIIFLILSFVIFIFLLKSTNNKKDILQVTQEKWQTEFSRREHIKSLVNSIQSIKSEMALFETHFIQSSDIVPFLNTIEKLAKDVKTEAEVISVDVLEDDSSLMVEMKVSGSFEAIYKLITLLENSPYELEFISVNIQNENEQDIFNNKNIKISQWIAILEIKLLSFVK